MNKDQRRVVVDSPNSGAPKSSAELQGLAVEVERLLLDEASVSKDILGIKGSFRRLYSALREMCSEMANLQLALAQAKAKIKALEEQLYRQAPVLEVSLG